MITSKQNPHFFTPIFIFIPPCLYYFLAKMAFTVSHPKSHLPKITKAPRENLNPLELSHSVYLENQMHKSSRISRAGVSLLINGWQNADAELPKSPIWVNRKIAEENFRRRVPIPSEFFYVLPDSHGCVYSTVPVRGA